MRFFILTLFLLVAPHFAYAEKSSYEQFFKVIEGWEIDENKTIHLFDDVQKFYNKDGKEISVSVYYKSPHAQGAVMQVKAYKAKGTNVLNINGYDAVLKEKKEGRSLVTIKISSDTAILIQQSENSSNVDVQTLKSFAESFNYDLIK